MTAWFYDIETYPNFICFVFVPVRDSFPLQDYIYADKRKDMDKKLQILLDNGGKIFIISEQINHLVELNKFVRNISILVGFNNRSFDDNILDYLAMKEKEFSKLSNILIITAIYAFAQELIGGNFVRYKEPKFKNFVQPYRSVDLYKVLRLDYSFTGLKQVAVNLKWYRIESLPHNPYVALTAIECIEVVDYCINDVLITRELYFKEISEVIQRFNATSIYGMDFLASSRSSMADRIALQLYCDRSGLKPWEVKVLRSETTTLRFKDIISPDIKFISPELTKFLEHLKSKVINVFNDKFSETIIYKGTSYTIAKGGIHSNDRPGYFESNEKYVYVDADVSSFYPFLIIKYLAVPRHLDFGIFLSIFKELVDERIKNKKLGNKDLADILKIVINAIYGKLGEETGWLYDLKALYTVTINGELGILSLAEELAEKFQIVSANTDGVLCKIERSRLEEYYKVCNDWCERTKFELEFTSFDKYIRLNVNNYIALQSDGDFKCKGLFNTKFQPGRGYNMPIIAKGVIAYFFDRMKPEDYVKQHNNIYDYCAAIKTGEQFTKELYSVTDFELTKHSLPKVVRYYCATDGGSVIKSYIDKDKKINMLKGQTVRVFNDYHDPPYNINYKYYAAQIYEVIYRISNVVTKTIKGTKSKSGVSGKLFDEIEDFTNPLLKT